MRPNFKTIFRIIETQPKHLLLFLAESPLSHLKKTFYGAFPGEKWKKLRPLWGKTFFRLGMGWGIKRGGIFTRTIWHLLIWFPWAIHSGWFSLRFWMGEDMGRPDATKYNLYNPKKGIGRRELNKYILALNKLWPNIMFPNKGKPQKIIFILMAAPLRERGVKASH